MATLPAQTKADRIALSRFSAADIEQTTVFVASMTAVGRARIRNEEATISGVLARQLWQAGQKGSRYNWDRATLQFLNGSTPVPRIAVKAASDAVSNQARYKMLDATLRLSQGKLTVAEWAVEHDQWMKALHGAETALGHGGFGEMTLADWDKASERVANQLGYSRAFAEDLAAGRYGAPGDKGFLADAALQRSGYYANAGRCTYENAQKDNARDRLGHTMARRILAAVAHCASCEETAAQGWMPIDEYPEIGDDDCHSNCQCVTITGVEGALID